MLMRYLSQKKFFLILCLSTYASLAAHSKTYYVSPNGDNSADGSENTPLKTIQQAAEQAQPGDTISVAPGIYRERIAPPRGGQRDRPIIYRSEKPHAAIVRGSAIWTPKWNRKAPQVWSGILEEALFPDTSHRDGGNPFLIPLSSTPGGRNGKPESDRKIPKSDPTIIFSLGQVFIDGNIIDQAPKEAEMLETANTWYYDAGSHQLMIHFADDKPEKHVVEVTNQRRLFAPHKRHLAYITVEGFIFEHCGNQYPTNFWEADHPEWQQAGAVGTRSGRNWVIRGNTIRFANGIGIDLGNEGNAQVDLEYGDNGSASGSSGHIIENNVLSDNGAGGTASYHGTLLTLRGNVIERNNRLQFSGPKRWESAGIKVHAAQKSIIENNLVRDNYGVGIWCDEGAGMNTQIRGNLIMNHKAAGLDFEIGSAPPSIVANNVFINNNVAIRARLSGGLTIMHNFIVDSQRAGIEFTTDPKHGGGWSAAHNAIYNNLFMGNEGWFLKLTAPDEVRCEDRRLDHNVYTANALDKRYLTTKEKVMDFAQWKSKWKDYNGTTDADANSKVIPGNTYIFNPETLELTLNIAFDPLSMGITPDSRVTGDYFHDTLPTALKIPGPFQSLKKGTQTFKLWEKATP